jgi:hypothetical protein
MQLLAGTRDLLIQHVPLSLSLPNPALCAFDACLELNPLLLVEKGDGIGHAVRYLLDVRFDLLDSYPDNF